MVDLIVMVPCPRDGQPIWMDFDPGEPQTWHEPGTPASWLPLAETTDGVPHCAHLFPDDLKDGLTADEWTAIENAAGAIMQPIWDAEAKAEADGLAAYYAEEAKYAEADARALARVGGPPDDLEDLPF